MRYWGRQNQRQAHKDSRVPYVVLEHWKLTELSTWDSTLLASWQLNVHSSTHAGRKQKPPGSEANDVTVPSIADSMTFTFTLFLPCPSGPTGTTQNSTSECCTRSGCESQLRILNFNKHRYVKETTRKPAQTFILEDDVTFIILCGK